MLNFKQCSLLPFHFPRFACFYQPFQICSSIKTPIKFQFPKWNKRYILTWKLGDASISHHSSSFYHTYQRLSGFYLFPKQIRPDLKYVGLPSARSAFSSKPSQLEYFFHYYFEMEKIALIFPYKLKFDFRVFCSALFHLFNFSATRMLSLRI